MTEKTNFERLMPADQMAIESMVQQANTEELKEVYKQSKAREAIRKKPGCGEIIAWIVIVSFIIILIVGAVSELDEYGRAIKSAGPAVCKSHNSTYNSIDFSGWDVKIICNDLTVHLP